MCCRASNASRRGTLLGRNSSMTIWRARAVHPVGALLIGALALGGGAKTPAVAASRKEPFKLEKIEGTERKRVRLEPKAAERLRIQTETVTQLPGAGGGPARA